MQEGLKPQMRQPYVFDILCVCIDKIDYLFIYLFYYSEEEMKLRSRIVLKPRRRKLPSI